MNDGVVSFSFRSSFLLDVLLRCSAFCSCTPKKDPKSLYFFVTATAFLTVLVRLTRPKARLTHLITSPSLALDLTWVTCVFQWPQSKTSRLVSWVQLGKMKVLNHPISVSLDKEKILSFCYSSCNSVIFQLNLIEFSVLESSLIILF